MSTTGNDNSDIKQAAEHANAKQIEKNLTEEQDLNTPELLTKEQKTSFIDETARTDQHK